MIENPHDTLQFDNCKKWNKHVLKHTITHYAL